MRVTGRSTNWVRFRPEGIYIALSMGGSAGREKKLRKIYVFIVLTIDRKTESFNIRGLTGGVAEWSKALVLKTSDSRGS